MSLKMLPLTRAVLVSWGFYLVVVGMSCRALGATYLGTLREGLWVQVKLWRRRSGPDIARSLAEVAPGQIGNLVGSESGSKMATALRREKKAWELFNIWQATPIFASALSGVSSLSPILARQGQLP
ncbi:hypothetical protein NDA11_003537 [Ustilago hordei]|uniref:Uncharacterized protein n=1 Tax=Ustilago hordei TaxID=120017 RepID=I2FMZ6_USTHO|nr:uncharacterized protein UHO2_05351 [Ustilago hordei]KAJ1039868.1 hypothetical protein NDA10_005780 [Ustilago hordei]KAJ1573970.1 hypothetical protein NDA12_000621 [Ustilago hordei]KAJ1574539.1 hypothetical protein NDA15_004992 [Ustilago hordei]KAJ1580305.1 hypothetical protein NDA11_003537 [Ustilago hordei]KAJ1599641.1 hypothetical protein NDA14_007078 [Ustilago hordei]